MEKKVARALLQNEISKSAKVILRKIEKMLKEGKPAARVEEKLAQEVLGLLKKYRHHIFENIDKP